MAKKVIGSVKLQVKGGQANPSPPIGPALGSTVLILQSSVRSSIQEPRNKWVPLYLLL